VGEGGGRGCGPCKRFRTVVVEARKETRTYAVFADRTGLAEKAWHTLHRRAGRWKEVLSTGTGVPFSIGIGRSAFKRDKDV